MAGLQAASLACVWALQHVALRARRWRPVIASQLAGSALAKIAPGGGAMGAALQYKMLVRSGFPAAATVTALTRSTCWCSRSCWRCRCWRSRRCCAAGSNERLLDTALVGLAIFVVVSILGAIVLSTPTAR